MLLMIKKYSLYFIVSLLVFVLLSALVIVLAHGNLQVVIFAVLTCSLFIYFNAIGPVFGSEQYEEKNNGYEFLKIFPLRELDIVGAKFLWALLVDAVFVGGILLFLSKMPWPEKQLVLIRSLALLNGSISLLLVAVSYVFIFWIGYTKYMTVVLSVLVALGFVPMIIIKFFSDNMDQVLLNIYNFIAGLNWSLILPVVLLVYVGLLLIAARIKKY
ncbi:MAG: ABC-2 transporter permease [Candidatus Aminicenantes bacterium]|nr:ABC-2 transporter permease [Candidatus Aminicenantes bacterium]